MPFGIAGLLVGKVWKAPLPPPVALTVSPDVADGLAQPVTVTGTGFVAGASVHLEQGGEFVAYLGSATVGNGGTTITCTTPSVAAGIYDIVVTNPDLQATTLPNGIELWHPLVDSPSLLLLPGNYSNSSPGTPSTAVWLDSSGHNRHAVAYNTNPAVASGDNEGCPLFADDSALDVPHSLADDFNHPPGDGREALVTHLNGTIVTIDIPAAPLEPEDAYYYNGAIISGSGATPGLAPVAATAGGTPSMKAWAYDGIDYQIPLASDGVAADTASITFTTWEPDKLNVRANGGAFVSAPLEYNEGTDLYNGLSVGNIGNTVHIGSSYAYTYL